MGKGVENVRESWEAGRNSKIKGENIYKNDNLDRKRQTERERRREPFHTLD